MKTISIINLKGGVGKTVTTVNLAAELAAAGKTVLVIDADPQANATAFYGYKNRDCNTVAGIMSGYADYVEDFIYDTRDDHIWLVPSEISLVQADIASVTTATGVKVLRSFVQAAAEGPEEEQYERFDYVLIDCPPSFTATSVAAIAASDEVITPVKLDAFALDGLRELTEQIEGVRAIKPGVRFAGVLITMWQNLDVVIQGERLLRESGLPVYKTHIRRSDKQVVESTFIRYPLREYSKTCGAARDYAEFAAEYLMGEGV